MRLVIAEDGLPVLVDDGPAEPVTIEETIEEIRAARDKRLAQRCADGALVGGACMTPSSPPIHPCRRLAATAADRRR